jgi:hypothetical protein
MKLFNIKFSPASCYFLPPRFKHFISVSHPYKTTSMITVLYVAIFGILYRRQEEKRFGTD